MHDEHAFCSDAWYTSSELRMNLANRLTHISNSCYNSFHNSIYLIRSFRSRPHQYASLQSAPFSITVYCSMPHFEFWSAPPVPTIAADRRPINSKAIGVLTRFFNTFSKWAFRRNDFAPFFHHTRAHVCSSTWESNWDSKRESKWERRLLSRTKLHILKQYLALHYVLNLVNLASIDGSQLIHYFTLKFLIWSENYF